MAKAIYSITITNWEKYNGNLKNGHKKILISTGFLSDAKIMSLSQGGKLLYLGLLLRCGEVTSNLVECSHDLLVTLAGGRGQVVSRLLEQMQSLRLLTFEKTALIEEKRIEKKGKEENRISSEVVERPSPAEFKPVLLVGQKERRAKNSAVWDAYAEAYYARYRVDPVRNKTTNTQVANLVKRLGQDEAVEVVKFYLDHSDGFYLKATHSIGLCLRDCESLRTQWARGRAITSRDVRSFERSAGLAQLAQDAEKGGF